MSGHFPACPQCGGETQHSPLDGNLERELKVRAEGRERLVCSRCAGVSSLDFAQLIQEMRSREQELRTDLPSEDREAVAE